jgi:hypothetical protein
VPSKGAGGPDGSMPEGAVAARSVCWALCALGGCGVCSAARAAAMHAAAATDNATPTLRAVLITVMALA